MCVIILFEQFQKRQCETIGAGSRKIPIVFHSSGHLPHDGEAHDHHLQDPVQENVGYFTYI